MSESKRCSKCGEVKAVEEFYVQRGSKNGYQCECKACLRIRTAAKRSACAPATEGTKQCSKCFETKPILRFPINKGANDGRASECKDCANIYSAKWKKQNAAKVSAGNRRYREAHLDEVRAKCCEATKRWYQANKDKIDREAMNAKSRKWHEDHREQALKRGKEYYLANREKTIQRVRDWRKDNPERAKELSAKNGREWTEANPDRSREKVRKRRMIRREVGGSHTLAEWRALVKRFGGRCVCCGEYCGIKKLHRDHVIPLTKGGTDDIENVQCLCATCNCSKGNRHSADYRKTPFVNKA